MEQRGDQCPARHSLPEVVLGFVSPVVLCANTRTCLNHCVCGGVKAPHRCEETKAPPGIPCRRLCWGL